MSEPLIDSLARSLASPMSRRSSIALFGGAMASAMVPSLLRPRAAFGDHCGGALKPCPAATGTGHFCCEKDTECCSGSEGNACCDPCFGERCRPGVGRCSQEEIVCTDRCCERFGQGECCGTLCCTTDQICDKARNQCCPPDPDAPKCNAPEPACKKEVDEEIESILDDCRGGGGDAFSNSAASMGDDGLQIMSCSFSANVITKSSKYNRCRQVPNNEACDGGRCNPKTLRCNQCADASASAERAAADSALSADSDDPAPPDGHSAAGVTKADLRRRLRKSRRRVGKAYAKMLREVRAPVEVALPRPELARAIKSYREEIIRLRESVAQGNGGRPQRLALTALDETAAGLAAYRRAALATTVSRATAESRRGKKRFKRAATAMTRTRDALDCGNKRCA